MNNNKAFLQAYKDQKGSEGEDFVQSCIEEALELSGIKTYKTYRNVVLQFPSVFGNYYGMTTEIDHTVVTRNFIFIFETKNHERYNEIGRLYWELANGEKIVNPIRQNHMHKLIIVSELKVERECIRPIECFPDKPYLRYKEEYVFPWLKPALIAEDEDPNNEVLSFNDEDFVTDLAYLFISANKNYHFDYDEVIKKIDELVSKQKRTRLNEIHLENVAEANAILNAQKGNYQKLEYTDVGKCSYCGKDTIKLIRYKPELEPGRKRRRYAYRTCFVCKNFNCSKFDKSQGEFDDSKILLGEYYPQSKKLSGLSVQIQTIQERIGITSMENFVETVKNRVDDLSKQISNLQAENRKLKYDLESKGNELEKTRIENREAMDSVRQATREVNRFKPMLFGLFYIRKK